MEASPGPPPDPPEDPPLPLALEEALEPELLVPAPAPLPPPVDPPLLVPLPELGAPPLALEALLAPVEPPPSFPVEAPEPVPVDEHAGAAKTPQMTASKGPQTAFCLILVAGDYSRLAGALEARAPPAAMRVHVGRSGEPPARSPDTPPRSS